MANKKTISIKLTASGPGAGPFDILDISGNVLKSDVSKDDLIIGTTFDLGENETIVKVVSTGNCNFEKTVTLQNIPNRDWVNAEYVEGTTGCLWSHLTNKQIYNYFYGNIEPYVVEYPFAYRYQDEILQNVKDYSKVYKYLPEVTGSFDSNRKIQVDDRWFNKAVLYNGQQSTGVLELVAKPQNNMAAYMQYPILNTDSKTITFTKSDNFYQYNTFWALQIDDQEPLFNSSCKSLSIDKEVNQANMNYGNIAFKKSPLRAKNLKVRHILDNSSTTHIVSQFIVTPAQISYK